ncbi:hypothetical protein [Lacticaseibacillus daqingensis]|uniref:hypothetical protein n=1 Tax=Lacticaseibacillus daqingensis TaxID=2486014 RepID=UPI0013DE512D|nr:hypothetical protein [Lacticaseibacillus daqingensis]
MSLFNKKPAAKDEGPKPYDFAQMVKQAQADPAHFSKVQEVFKKLRHAPKNDPKR